MKWIHWTVIGGLILIGLFGDVISFLLDARGGEGLFSPDGDETIIETGTLYWAIILAILGTVLDRIIESVSPPE